MSTEALDLSQETRSPVLNFLDTQLQVLSYINWILTWVNPFYDPDKIFTRALEDLQRSLRSYGAEENLRPASVVQRFSNGTNPYHGFLEVQKAKKTNLEFGLTQIKAIKRFLPVLPPILQLLENAYRTHLAFTFTFDRPEWGLEVEPSKVDELDFVDILKFEAKPETSNGRNMLLIAPMSGHFATLLRKTVESLHREGYTVYVTDWKSPFDVPKAKGEFTVDRHTTELLNAFASVKKDAWEFDVLAVCQPSPETLTATTYAETNNLPGPRSIALMAGPIDVSQSPTMVNEASKKLTPDFLERLKFTIPDGREVGWGRSVYPGAVQISGFMATKIEEHLENFLKLSTKTTPFTPEEEKQIAFYTEYFAVMDLPYEFYRETVERVFRRNEWAKGKVAYNWGVVDLSLLTKPLITIEWLRDDICGVGQTSAAHNITNSRESDHIPVPNAGHYGTFAGKDFRGIVLPRLDAFYRKIEVANDPKYRAKPTRKKA
jgi:poly(3-hydroxybutyrate) depolymerase